MKRNAPKVSIGLPVYNGERYIATALDALLGQSCADFELIISDNGSSDGTQDICQRYAAQDGRIRFVRNDMNLGAAWNHNRVFALSSGQYFKWAAHDDVCDADFLGRCVAVLDQDPSVVLCYPQSIHIDEQGRPLGTTHSFVDAGSTKPHQRFRNLISMRYSCEALCGVIRRHTLTLTGLIGKYADSDRVLLAELGLHGQFRQVPEVLFRRRRHAKNSARAYPGRHERTAWFDPTAAGRIVLPYWREFVEYCRAIRRSPIDGSERIRCYGAMCTWLKDNQHRLRRDVFVSLTLLVRARMPASVGR